MALIYHVIANTLNFILVPLIVGSYHMYSLLSLVIMERRGLSSALSLSESAPSRPCLLLGRCSSQPARPVLEKTRAAKDTQFSRGSKRTKERGGLEGSPIMHI